MNLSEVNVLAQLGSAMKNSLAVMRRHFATLWSATAWPYMVMIICFLIARFVVNADHDPSKQWDPVTLWHSMGVPAKLGLLLAYLACISFPNGFATAGATVVIWADLQGEEVDLQSVFLRIGQVFLRLTGLSLCIGIMCSIGGAFLYLPGVLVFAFMSFTIPVLVIEDAKVLTALRRGINLASMRFGTLLGLYAVVLLVLVATAIGVVFVAPIADLKGWTGIIAFWALIVAILPILMMVTTAVVVHLYRDLREQRGELAARNPAA